MLTFIIFHFTDATTETDIVIRKANLILRNRGGKKEKDIHFIRTDEKSIATHGISKTLGTRYNMILRT
jgi:hypothetical protein